MLFIRFFFKNIIKKRRLFSIMATGESYSFIDIGANLTDPMYQGVYYGKNCHPPDLDSVLKRSYETGVEKIIVTGGSLSDCKDALQLSLNEDHLYTTVGVHPTRCGDFETEPQKHLSELLNLAKENRKKVVAIGECGLDYDRLHFCDKSTQLKYFEEQLSLAEETSLPLFLHCRNSFSDFMSILKRNRNKIRSGGVIHSFDGTEEEMREAVEFGLHVGVNGCSLKTSKNLEVVKEIPADRLLLETDAPWCEIRPSHSSHQFVKTHFPSKKKERWEEGESVKSRNEPRNIIQVLEVVAGVRGVEPASLAKQVYQNTVLLFKF
ncbi:PREDICTED: putative deoxyribonuclease TATDN1 isoform X2 [Amphimedon queenslandica]|uniref:Deoxyribonuclease TATDN1 n=2 Tax=Amphimedon queenslandica TaxID=400682 RepID=A0AAN0IQZ1_AMPQE|nr:PREDICTED: putative deoxyribonuclease TATDN1 isoform X2 [Amphimedon queenslandica]|eukprot:XP_011407800.2 PREDICTED: putative deoxyribonuclease TATDN1 isoform X2 [Amphimedon queenslandica]